MELHLNQRELNVVEIISEAWQIFKKNFQVFVPVILLIVLLNITHTTVTHFYFKSSKIGDLFSSQLLLAFYGILINLLNISFILIIDSTMKGEIISFEETINKATVFWPSSIGANILALLILVGLFLLIIVPGIIWSVYYSFVTIVVVLKGKKGKEALDYSKSIVKKRWWKVFFVIAVIVILAMAPGMLMSGIYFITQKNLSFRSAAESMPLVLKLFMSLISSLLTGFIITAKVVFFRNIEYLSGKHQAQEELR